MKCLKCHADSPPESVFCVECGSKLGLQCPRCGQPLEPRFKFCNKCGQDLSKPAAALESSPAPLTTTAATASPTPAAAPEGDRREATVLFSDLCGYTAMNERLDPEEVVAIMARIKEEAVRIVEGYGGIVNQFVGDEVLALFGIPTAHQDDPVRAVRAALALHEMTRAISPELEPRLGRAVRLHTGINTGLIVTSLRDDRDGRIGVTGDTINTGARLKSLAQDDTILLGPETRKLVSDEFETEPLKPVALRGKAGQITPYRLIGERSAPATASQPIIGRRAEIRQFTGIVEECEESGRGQAVYVRADVGVGKSRLVDEFQTIASRHGFACHKGLVLDFGAAKGHDAVRGVVGSLLGLQVGASEDVRREAVAQARADGIVDEPQVLFLNDLLDLPQPPDLRSIYDAMDNETRNRGKRETLCELLRRMSANRPVMVEIENIQWADDITLAHLAALAATVAEVRALMIMTSRLEGDPLNQAWRAASHGSPLSTIDLGPLRTADALDLARQYLDVSAQVAERCIERAAGNPLFLVQLLRTARESSEDSVPGSVQSLVLARVDRLHAEDRQAIQVASVFGQQFSLAALRALLGNPGYRCDALVAHLLVRPEGEDYLFAHALIQEGVYGSLLMARRADLHRRAAEWFTTRDLPLRAEHLDRAKDPTASQAFLEAARDQGAAFRYERALALAERGLELDAEPRVRFPLTCYVGELRRKLGRSTESIDAYCEAERLAADDIQRCHAWIGQVEGLRLIDRYQDALALLEKAEKPATENNLAAELAQLHYLRGNICFPLGDLNGCLREHGAALKWAREAGTPEAEARALGGLGDAHYLGGRMKTAHDNFQRCVDLSRQHGLGQVEVANLPMVGWSAIYTDALDRALESAQAASETARKVSHYRAESQGRSLAGFIKMEMGAFADAREQMNLALALSRKLKARRFEAHFLCDLARLAEAEGNRSDASKLVEQALNICRDTGMNYIGPTVLGCLARIADDSETRRRALEEGKSILRTGCVSHNYFWFYRDAMEACLDTGDWDAVERYAAALDDYTRAEPVPWSGFFTARGRALATLGRGLVDDALRAKLHDLSGEAQRLGLKVAALRVQDALRAT
jgi:class 3 adenylate cyclase/tetratricopeptide (TPR) repeat protein